MKLNKKNVLESLLKYNYFPDQKSDNCELPPIFSSQDLTLDILNKVLSLIESYEYFSDHYSHGVRYRVSKRNSVRELAIPEPAAYMKLLKLVDDHFELFQNNVSGINQFSMQEHDDGRVFILDYDSGYQTYEKATSLAFGKHYRVHVDIKRCFSSMTSDVMEQAIFNSRIGSEISHNEAFDVWQDWRDQGLPIGPGASNVLSEFILSSIDQKLAQIKSFDYYRYIDDYVCFANDLEEANEFVSALTMALSSVGLKLNVNKTRIVELPQPLEPEWKLDLYSRIPQLNDPEWYGNKLQRFLDYAQLLAKKHPDQFVMKYALKSVLNITNIDLDASLIRYVVNLLPFYAELTPYFGQVYKLINDTDSHDAQLHQQINDCLALYITEQRSDAMCWMIYWMTQLGIEILPINLDDIIRSEDTMAILSLYANGIHKQQVIRYANEHCTINGEELEKNWLLLYQVYIDGYLKDDEYFEFDRVYQMLKQSNVSFLRSKHANKDVHSLDGFVDNQLESEARFYVDPPSHCDLCSAELAEKNYFTDGQTRNGQFAFMCGSCFDEQGMGIGYGIGQLYKRKGNNWVLVAGARPETELLS